jgi:hypothetical protein
MKIDQQRKVVFIVGVLSLVAIPASSLAARKYSDHIGYVGVGLAIFTALVTLVAIFIVRNKAT